MNQGLLRKGRACSGLVFIMPNSKALPKGQSFLEALQQSMVLASCAEFHTTPTVATFFGNLEATSCTEERPYLCSCITKPG